MKQSKEPGDAQVFTGAVMIGTLAFSFLWCFYDLVLPIKDHAFLNLESTLWIQLRKPNVLVALAWLGIVGTALTSFGENHAMKR